MLKFSLLFLFFNSLIVAFSQKSSIEIIEPFFEFQDVEAGKVVEHTYEFVNTSNIPVIISGYKVACNCTKATYSDKPILPGEKGFLKVTFDSTNTFNQQDRTVVFQSNTKKPIKVRFKIYVNSKD